MAHSSAAPTCKKPAGRQLHPLQRHASQIGISLLAFVLSALVLHLASGWVLSLFDRAHAPTSSGYLPSRTILLRELLVEALRLLCTLGALLPPLFLLRRVCRLPFSEKGTAPLAVPRDNSLSVWVLIFLPVIGAAALLFSLLRLAVQLVRPLVSSAAPALPDFPLLLLSFFTLCLLPALLEELLFRGCILRALLPFGERFAVVCAGLLFSLLHANLLQLPSLLLISYFLGWAALRTRSCFVPLVLHLLYNTASLLLSYASQHLTPFAAPLLSMVFLFVCVLTGVLSIPALRRQGQLPVSLGRKKSVKGERSRLSLLCSAPLFTGSLVLLLCYCILLQFMKL